MLIKVVRKRNNLYIFDLIRYKYNIPIEYTKLSLLNLCLFFIKTFRNLSNCTGSCFLACCIYNSSLFQEEYKELPKWIKIIINKSKYKNKRKYLSDKLIYKYLENILDLEYYEKKTYYHRIYGKPLKKKYIKVYPSKENERVIRKRKLEKLYEKENILCMRPKKKKKLLDFVEKEIIFIANDSKEEKIIFPITGNMKEEMNSYNGKFLKKVKNFVTKEVYNEIKTDNIFI